MMDLASFLLGLFTAAAGVLLFNLFRILFSDADLYLLSKGPAPRAAFQGKVVWITGASQGIGELLAVGFARLGAKLILSARSVEKLSSVKEACEAISECGGALVLPLDLTSSSTALKAAVAAAEAAYGSAGVDVLVHNAAFPRPKYPCEDNPEGFLQDTFQVNVLGTIDLTQALLPHMLRRHNGHFVVVSSAAGKLPAPTQSVYAASKFALQGYFLTLNSELSTRGVSATLVCPGPIAPPRPLNASPEDTLHWAEEDRARMSCERCAELIIAAAAHKVPEAWVSTQPVLLLMYVAQYLPAATHYLFRKIGPKRVAALKSGSKDLYSTNVLFAAKKTK